MHFNWNTSLALNHSSTKCSCYTLIWWQLGALKLQGRDSSYWSLKGLAINRYAHYSRKAVMARVRLLDAPNIPLSPHCSGINNCDNISNPQIVVTEVPLLSFVICGKYSFIHPFHTCLVSFCSLLQRFLGLNDSKSTLSGTKSPPIYPIRKWFGVKKGRR